MPNQSLDPRALAAGAIEVFAPARLHLGFLDLNGDLGRRFGSIGLAIEGIGVRIVLSRADRSVAAPDRAQRLLDGIADRLGLVGPFRLQLRETIPSHVGLGSGTQLGLAIATALTRLAGTPTSARDLAPFADRGARSGIGIGAFEQGGFLVDGGKGRSEAPAPIVARLDFPPSWRLILIFDGARQGLSGEAESAAFRALPPSPAETASELCRITLMRLLPGLAEADFAAVAHSIGEIQARVGDHFAPAQGGRFSSSLVSDALGWLGRAGFEGIGQSSWGPTGFVLVPDEARALALRDELAARFDTSLSFRVCGGRNRGAEIRTIDIAAMAS
jgi:beta-RFAP synthase